MKKLLILFLAIIPTLGFGQAKETLSQLLWRNVNNCYAMFEDMDDDGTPDYTKIDDSKNGYLKISGSWPTCGCECTSTVGAYKNSAGEYILLQSDEMVCSWERKVSSNKKLAEILPKNFGINSFLSDSIADISEYAVFFIDFEIPQIGTDTKAKIELVPFGVFPNGNRLSCFEYSEQNQHKSLNGIKDIAKEMMDENTLNYLLTGDFEKISTADNKIISNGIGEGDNNFKSINEVQEYLIKLKKVYDVYCKLETNELILSWNRIESRFVINEKGKSIEKISFRDFLITNEYWDWRC